MTNALNTYKLKGNQGECPLQSEKVGLEGKITPLGKEREDCMIITKGKNLKNIEIAMNVARAVSFGEDKVPHPIVLNSKGLPKIGTEERINKKTGEPYTANVMYTEDGRSVAKALVPTFVRNDGQFAGQAPEPKPYLKYGADRKPRAIEVAAKEMKSYNKSFNATQHTRTIEKEGMEPTKVKDIYLYGRANLMIDYKDQRTGETVLKPVHTTAQASGVKFNPDVHFTASKELFTEMLAKARAKNADKQAAAPQRKENPVETPQVDVPDLSGGFADIPSECVENIPF